MMSERGKKKKQMLATKTYLPWSVQYDRRSITVLHQPGIKQNAAATVLQKLNQRTTKGMDFLWLLSFFQEKESNKHTI